MLGSPAHKKKDHHKMTKYTRLLILAYLTAVFVGHVESIATTGRVTGMTRWFPNKAIDYGKIPVSYNVLKSPALDVRGRHQFRLYFSSSHQVLLSLVSVCTVVRITPCGVDRSTGI